MAASQRGNTASGSSAQAALPRRLAAARKNGSPLPPARSRGGLQGGVCVMRLIVNRRWGPAAGSGCGGCRATKESKPSKHARKQPCSTHAPKAEARTKPSPAGPKPLPGVVTMLHFSRISANTSQLFWPACEGERTDSRWWVSSQAVHWSLQSHPSSPGQPNSRGAGDRMAGIGELWPQYITTWTSNTGHCQWP